MTDEELYALAERLRYSPFASGNIITRQGAASHWLYIIITGEAEVYLKRRKARNASSTSWARAASSAKWR